MLRFDQDSYRDYRMRSVTSKIFKIASEPIYGMPDCGKYY